MTGYFAIKHLRSNNDKLTKVFERGALGRKPMSEFIINDDILNQEARAIVEEILTQAEEGDDVINLIRETLDGHEWVFYYHKALKLCAECNTYDGEDMLNNIEQHFTEIGEHASAVAYWTLYVACVNCLNETKEAA